MVGVTYPMQEYHIVGGVRIGCYKLRIKYWKAIRALVFLEYPDFGKDTS